MKRFLIVLVLMVASPVWAQFRTTANVAVIMVSFPTYPDDPPQPWPDEQLVMFTQDEMAQAANYWSEVSYGKFTMSWQVFGVYHVPLDRTATRWMIRDAAKAAAAAAGVDLAPFTHFVFAAPVTDNAQAGICIDAVYINAASYPTVASVVTHELGHCMMGLYNHSDIYSVMGGAARGGHLSAWNKEKRGWLGPVGPTYIQTVTTSGDYLIRPFEFPRYDGPLALRIVRDSSIIGGIEYYLEYRQPIGWDWIIQYFPFEGRDMVGVFSHYQQFGDPVYFINGDPGPAWVVGKPYCDKSAKLEITVVSESSDGAVVRVTYRSNCNPKAGQK